MLGCAELIGLGCLEIERGLQARTPVEVAIVASTGLPRASRRRQVFEDTGTLLALGEPGREPWPRARQRLVGQLHLADIEGHQSVVAE